MRDYYSLVKCLAQKSDLQDKDEQRRLIMAIERNFGGLSKGLDKVFIFSLLLTKYFANF